MKLFRCFPIAFWITCCIVFMQTGRADSVRLKDGSIVEGDISSDTETNLVIEVRMGGGAIIGRTIDKAEIDSVTRDTPEQKHARAMAEAYRKLQMFQLNPTNVYTLAYYDQVIKGVFRPFLATYPDATQANDVKTRLAAWETERQQVADGNIKRGGRWITPAEAKTLDDKARLDQLNAQLRTFLAAKHFDKAIPIIESFHKNETDADRKADLDRQIEQAYKDWAALLQASSNQSAETTQRLMTKIEVADQARESAEDTYRNTLERYQRDPSSSLGLRAELAMQLDTLNKHEAEIAVLKRQLAQAEQGYATTSNFLSKATARIDAYQAEHDKAAHLAALERAKLEAIAKKSNQVAALLEPFEVPAVTKTREVKVLAAPVVQPPKPPPPPPPKEETFADWLGENWIIAGIGAVLALGFFLKILQK